MLSSSHRSVVWEKLLDIRHKCARLFIEALEELSGEEEERAGYQTCVGDDLDVVLRYDMTVEPGLPLFSRM
jgi:hypothetical protein